MATNKRIQYHKYGGPELMRLGASSRPLRARARCWSECWQPLESDGLEDP